MKTLKKYLSDKTVKIRYKFVIKIIRKITPNLFNKINLICCVSSHTFLEYGVSTLPRPAIIKMVDYFSNCKIVGAEIGVYKGDNAKSILNLLNIEKLFLIDIWDKTIEGIKNRLRKYKSLNTYKEVLKRFKNNDSVHIIKSTSKIGSESFENECLDFVYIDANHSYQEVFNDLNYWFPKVRSGGIIAGHDVFNLPDVLNAVKTWCEINKVIFTIKLPDWYFVKI